MTEQIDAFYSNIVFYFTQYADRYSVLFPLGIIGIWRWSVWSLKEIVGWNYKPKTGKYDASVSVVTPVYNEDPKLFAAALVSWEKNNPKEIIAVIDYADKDCILVFNNFARNNKRAKLIVTEKPGKRPALADGVEKATSEIVALVDSDTIWANNVIRYGLPPFQDAKVAGVATYQNVWEAKTFAQKIFDIQLDLRYMHEYPFLAAAGDALVCLSGRTAFYRRSVILPMMDDLVHEKFLGSPVISGDDKCLTYLVLKAGYKTAYQSNSHVYTLGTKDLRSYLKQRLRWTRNSMRADLKALFSGWPFKYPALLFFQIDKILQSFVIILSPIFFLMALAFHQWIVALVIFCWWSISRTVKIYPHLSKKPKSIVILPGFVLYSFFTGILRIYAFFTLNTQGWITRWDKSRLPQYRFLSTTFASFATVSVVVLLSMGVYEYRQYTYFTPHAKKAQLLASALPQTGLALAANNEAVLGISTSPQKELLVQKYETKKGDTLASVAQQFGVDVNKLYLANSAKLPITGRVSVGTVFSVPGKDAVFDSTKSPDYSTQPSALALRVVYDKATNTIVVMGRGKQVRLKDIRDNGGKGYIEEIAPKIWLAKASIFLYNGVTLNLDKSEVQWLKLESNKKQFVLLRSLNADIMVNGVKITSWDSEKNDYDKDLSDGRSFIMVRDNARMDLYESEIAYLGYPTTSDLAVSPYGISWRVSTAKLKKVLSTGEVINSKFHHNYFGAYTYGATGMTWKGNEFYENVRYGLDPHDDSDGFLIEKNYSHNNGTHGIIFSKRCMYNTIRDNVSVDNGLHGIMLHEESDYNIVEDNTVSGNVSGIALWKSSGNIIQNNTIKSNNHGVRANVSSNGNIMRNNDISDSKQYGFYLYQEANSNQIYSNTLEHNDVAIYVKSSSNQIYNNTLINNGVSIYFLDSASNNLAQGNNIRQSSVYAIYTKVKDGLKNVLNANTLYRNHKDIEGQEQD